MDEKGKGRKGKGEGGSGREVRVRKGGELDLDICPGALEFLVMPLIPTGA